LREKGLTLAPNAWGLERHNLLMQSRVMLHVHQNNHRYVAPQRWALAAAYKLPMVSETLDNLALFHCTGVLTYDYEELSKEITSWVKTTDKGLTQLGEHLHQFLCFDHPFAREVMRNV